MPIVPYIRLSEMIMIGAAPYWQAVAISLPIINAPPSPRKATTCFPGRPQCRRDRHRHAGAHRPDYRGQEDLALAEADIAVDEAAEIAGVGGNRRVGREVLVDLTDDRGEIDPVLGRLPFLGQQFALDRVEARDPALAFF